MERMNPRVLGAPEPGYWLIRLVRNGPLVPASIQWEQTRHEPGEPANLMDRSAVLTARINGEVVDIDRVWLQRGRAIDKAEHDYRVRVTDWAMQHKPDDPAADPTKPIDLGKLPPLF